MNNPENNHRAEPNINSRIYTVASHFLEHRDILVTETDIAYIVGHNGMLDGNEVAHLPSRARQYLQETFIHPISIVNIPRAGWASYDSVSPGDIIKPEGLFPDPLWNGGNPEKIYQIRQLYETLRYARVTEKINTAVMPISPALSRYLEELSFAYTECFWLDCKTTEETLGVNANAREKLEHDVRIAIDRETNGLWTIDHKKGNKNIPGLSSLVLNG